MKYLGKISLSLLIMLSIWACQKQPAQTVTEEKKAPLPTFMDSVSYAYGISIGKDFQNNNIKGMNGDFIGKGILAVTDTTDSLLLSDQDAKAVIQEFAQKLQEEQQRVQEIKNTKNKEEGIAFLEQNKKRPGVITLASGLQYEVIKEGTGAKPTIENQVKVHYHGTFLNGKVFDSSVEKGRPATFGLQQVIPGWTEILQLMPTGSKWKVYIPQDKAYGERGNRGIEPFTTLIFDIELLEIVEDQPAYNPNVPK